jgi:pilus assembly protein Flp/PilA
VRSTRIPKELTMIKLINRFAKDESGATAIEYGLIAGLVSVALITVLGLLKTNLVGTFTKIKDALPQ